MDSYTLRLEAPYTQSRAQTTILDRLPGVRQSWERTENRWGYFQGRFSAEGTLAQLIEWHRLWLGRDVVERGSGDVAFAGYIHELRLYHQDVCRVYGYDVGGEMDLHPPGMFNAVRVAIGSLVENAEFEQDGVSPAVFANWDQVIGSGDSIGKETTDPIVGGQSPKLTNGGSGNTYIAQAIPVRPNTAYSLRFVSAGDGSASGRYQVRNATSGTDIIPLTGTENSGLGQFRSVTEEIVTPAGCDSLQLRLYAPASAGYAVFDSVALQRVDDGRLSQDYTPWATQAQSIAAHGRREMVLDGGALTPLEAVALRNSFLAARAWPQERQENGDGSTRLEVYVLGYIHRADWLFTDDSINGQSAAASAHVAAIFGQLPWATGTAVNQNSAPITLQEQPQTLLSALRQIVEVGDGEGRMWRVYGEYGRLFYVPVNFTPTLNIANGQIYRRMGERGAANIRTIRAMSVVRDLDFPDRSVLPGSHLQQRNDSLLESITVGPNGMRRGIGGI